MEISVFANEPLRCFSPTSAFHSKLLSCSSLGKDGEDALEIVNFRNERFSVA